MSGLSVRERFTDPSSVWANLQVGHLGEKFVYILKDKLTPLSQKIIYVAVLIIGMLAVDYKMGHSWTLVLGGSLLVVFARSVSTLNAKMRRAYIEKCIIDVLVGHNQKNIANRRLESAIPYPLRADTFANEVFFTSFDPKNPVAIEQLTSPEGESSLHLHLVDKKTGKPLQLFVAYFGVTEYPKWYCRFWSPEFTSMMHGEVPVLRTVKWIIDGKDNTYELRSS